MLLRDQSRANPSAQVLVQEPRDLLRANVLPRAQEASCQDLDCIAVRVYQIRHDLRELDLIFQRLNLPLCEWQKRAQAVQVVTMDLADVGVCDDDVRQGSQGLDAVGEARGQDLEGEVGAIQQRLCRERWVAMLAEVC